MPSLSDQIRRQKSLIKSLKKRSKYFPYPLENRECDKAILSSLQLIKTLKGAIKYRIEQLEKEEEPYHNKDMSNSNTYINWKCINSKLEEENYISRCIKAIKLNRYKTL